MKNRMFIKLLILGVITLVLMGILSAISGLTQERKGRLAAVERDIANGYAGEQRMGGPVFSVVFREYWTERIANADTGQWHEKEMSAVRSRLVFPAVCSYDGTLSVQERYRGIFKANVFQSGGTVSGSVVFPTLASLASREESRVELLAVNACILIDDPRGLPSIPTIEWNGQTVEFAAGSTLRSSGAGIHAELPDAEQCFGRSFTFAMQLEVNGTRQIQFVPVGTENHVSLQSGWPHPSFTGHFLASERDVEEDGFSAEWNVNALASSAQQDLTSGTGEVQSFGVSLIDPISPYPLTDRAIKYGFLFILIMFAAFWLFEVLADLQVHPIQYGFVGLAQAVFFLLLLSISEHGGFGVAYGVASGATIALIVSYVCFILHGLTRGLLFGGLLALLYGVLYLLLLSEDHALVAGSALLFGLMALAMMLTRKVDWYALGGKAETTG